MKFCMCFIIMFFVFIVLRYTHSRVEKLNPAFLIYYKVFVSFLIYITISIIALKYNLFYIILTIQGLYMCIFFIKNLFTWHDEYYKFKSNEKKSFYNKFVIHLKILKILVVKEIKNIDFRFIEAKNLFYKSWKEYRHSFK